jgi:hypothetical protein
MAEGRAGGSADDYARRLRARAAVLETQAAKWELGAEGERRTGLLLAGVTGPGVIVLHDLSIPGSRANIDHVVISRSGIVVIDSKQYSGRLNISDGVLWHGRYPLRREVETILWETNQVRTAVADLGWPIPVRPLVCIHGSDVPRARQGALPVELCAPASLQAEVLRGPRMMSEAQVSAVAAAIEVRLPAKTTDATAPPQPTKQPHPRREPRAGGSLKRLTLAVLAFLAVLLSAGTLQKASTAIAKAALPAPPSTAPGALPAPPNAPSLTWACPSPGAGWTAALTWTPSTTPKVWYAAEWRNSSTGSRPAMVIGATARMTGVASGTAASFVVESVLASHGQMVRSVEVATEALAPAEPC